MVEDLSCRTLEIPMHIRWRGLELPAAVTIDPASRSETYGRFVAEPFERGFGTTIGNSIRRILLSSLEGAAVTNVQITGVAHEFSTIPGILEDVTDILLNCKDLVIDMDGDQSQVLRLRATGKGAVTAEHIECPTGVTIINKDRHIATLTGDATLEMQFTVERGRGYQPASEQYSNGQEQVIGVIPIDAIFSPVQRVRYRVEATRVGQRTNYDKLILDVWTNGTVSPEMAVVEAAKIMRKHLNPFVQYATAGDALATQGIGAESANEEERNRKLAMSIADLELGVRSSNCLESAQIRFVHELVTRSIDDLLQIRAFGKTSLREVEDKLGEHGLSLGMRLPEGFTPPVQA